MGTGDIRECAAITDEGNGCKDGLVGDADKYKQLDGGKCHDAGMNQAPSDVMAAATGKCALVQGNTSPLDIDKAQGIHHLVK